MMNDEDKKEYDLIKLTEKEKKLKVKQLRKNLRDIKKQNNVYRNKISELSSKIVDEWKLERELNILTHQFQRKDIVLLNTREIAEIQQLVGIYHYKVFIHDSHFRGGIGTQRKIHNDEILCHITDLCLEEKDINYKQKGYRRLNIK